MEDATPTVVVATSPEPPEGDATAGPLDANPAAVPADAAPAAAAAPVDDVARPLEMGVPTPRDPPPPAGPEEGAPTADAERSRSLASAVEDPPDAAAPAPTLLEPARLTVGSEPSVLVASPGGAALAAAPAADAGADIEASVLRSVDTPPPPEDAHDAAPAQQPQANPAPASTPDEPVAVTSVPVTGTEATSSATGNGGRSPEADRRVTDASASSPTSSGPTATTPASASGPAAGGAEGGDPEKSDKKKKKKKKKAKSGGDAEDGPEDGGSTPNQSPLEPTRRQGSGGLHRGHATLRGGGNGGISPPDDAKKKSKKRSKSSDEKKRKGSTDPSVRIASAGGGDSSGATGTNSSGHPVSQAMSSDLFHLPGVPHAAVQLGDNRVVVHVRSMGPLEPNVDVVHPFVRVWLVDAANGESLSLRGMTGEPESAHTHPFDLRDHESVAPKWDEHVALDISEPIGDAEEPMLLFELFDFGNVNIRGEPKSSDIVMVGPLMPIAWGFLNMRDAYGRSNFGRTVSVQLLRAPEQRGFFGSIAASFRTLVLPGPQTHAKAGWAPPRSDDTRRIPPVFRHMMNPLNRSDYYDAGLSVEVTMTDDTFTPPAPSNLTYKDELLMERLQHLFAKQAAAAGGVGGRRSTMFVGGSQGDEIMESRLLGRRGGLAAENERRKHALLMQRDFSRGLSERCLPPQSRMHTVRIDAKVSAMAFSPDGDVLAVAETADLVSSVRLFHVTSPRNDRVGDLKGHVGFIHTVLFSPDGKLLLTASGDKTVRVWDVSQLPVFDVPPLQVFGHAGHVYSACFLQRSVVSAGIDGHLHLWSVDDGALRCRTPNSLNACFRTVVTNRDSHLVSAAAAGEGDVRRSRSLRSLSSVRQPERAKFWTLDSVGTFSAWSAGEFETTARSFRTIEQRTRIQIQGATRVHLEGRNALLYVPSDAPNFVLVNTRTMTVLGTVGIGRVPHHLRHATPRLPTALLPDSTTAVIALTSASVIAIDLNLGEMFTPKDGFVFAADKKHPTQIAWSPNRHIAALSHVDTEGPLGTVITINGRPRAAGEECYTHDPQALNVLRHLYGGEVKVQSDRVVAPFTSGFGRQGTSSGLGAAPSGSSAQAPVSPRKPRNAGSAGRLAAAPAQAPLTGDLQTRFEQIIRYWRGRVATRSRQSEAMDAPAAGVSLPVPGVDDPPAPGTSAAPPASAAAAADAGDRAATEL